jgi:hypothetical protein
MRAFDGPNLSREVLMEREWKLASSGLFVPARYLALQEEVVDSNERRHRILEMRFTSLQTWATIVALVISAGGLWLGYQAFRDQQSVSRAQQEITAEQQGKEKRRYADQVNWWIEQPSGSNSIIHIENRSSAPVSPILVANSAQPSLEVIDKGDSFATLSGTPPCTAVSFEVPTNSGDLGSTRGSLIFGDPVGYWIKSNGQTEEYRPAGNVNGENYVGNQADLYVHGKRVGKLLVTPHALPNCGEPT